MNRLPLPGFEPQAAKSSESEPKFESQVGAGRAAIVAGDSPAVVFGPMHYERNYAYPLLVWLHGSGTSERQLLKLMPLVSLRNYVATAPRGTMRTASDTAEKNAAAFTWSQASGDFDAAVERVFDSIESARERYHVSRRRVFLAGADVGGTLALRIALAHPDRFAGVLSLGGVWPGERAPLRRLLEVKRLPMFLAYGRDDADFHAASIQRQLRLFHAGGLQVSIRQYPCGAEIAPQMLCDMDRWMMEIVTGGAACVS